MLKSLFLSAALAFTGLITTSAMAQPALPQPKAVKSNIPVTAGIYTINRGDTFLGIANKYGMTLTQLQNMNAKINPDNIKAGDKIFVITSSADQLKKNHVIVIAAPVTNKNAVLVKPDMPKLTSPAPQPRPKPYTIKPKPATPQLERMQQAGETGVQEAVRIMQVTPKPQVVVYAVNDRITVMEKVGVKY